MEFSKEFGGGGHEKAAGIFLEGPIDDVANMIITRLEKYLG